MPTKECWSCFKFKAYYTKGIWLFDKSDVGFCVKNKKICNKHNTCNSWYSNQSRKETRKEVALKGLIETLETLSQVNQIIIEDSKNEEE